MRKFLLLITLILFAVSIGAVAWTTMGPTNPINHGLAEFSVDKMTCGSCVGNIQDALAAVPGIGAVEVSVTAGRARVEYDPEELDTEAIAEKISAEGYPAQARQVLSPGEYRSFRKDQDRLAEKFVGRIGERLISREAFARAVAEREGDPAALRQGLLRSAWEELRQRELLLAAAEENEVVVQKGEVDLEIERLRQKQGDAFMKRVTARHGDLETFRRRLKEKLVIERNLSQHVLPEASEPARRRAAVQRWYQDLVDRTPVIIFDPALKAVVNSAGSGCGGSCCG